MEFKIGDIVQCVRYFDTEGELIKNNKYEMHIFKIISITNQKYPIYCDGISTKFKDKSFGKNELMLVKRG